MKREDLLKNIYIILMILLFIFTVLTPLLVSQGVSVIGEEILESAMLFALGVIGFVIYSFYRKNLEQRERELNETFNYIGSVNLQVDQIKSIFDVLTKYPGSKKDFKYLFESLADKALAGVNSEWVLFRIIDSTNGKTLTEYTKARGSAVILKCEIKNSKLLESEALEGCYAVSSKEEKFNIKVFCVMPVQSLNENQEFLLKAIVNNLSMLYLIFKSAEEQVFK